MARGSGLSAETLRSSATHFPVVGSNESGDSLPADANISPEGQSSNAARAPAANFTPLEASVRLAERDVQSDESPSQRAHCGFEPAASAAAALSGSLAAGRADRGRLLRRG